MGLQKIIQIQTQNIGVGRSRRETDVAKTIAQPMTGSVVVNEAFADAIEVIFNQLNDFPQVAFQSVGMTNFNKNRSLSGFVIAE